MQIYCLVCKKVTDNDDTKTFIIKDERLKIMPLCTICGHKKVKYISKWSSSLDNLMINYKHGEKQ